MRATRAIIHLDNFGSNLKAVRAKIGPHPQICAAIKADAYGHGAIPLARFALGMDAEATAPKGADPSGSPLAGPPLADCLAVAAVNEGADLRQAGIKARIFVLSQVLPEEVNDIVNADLIPLVSDKEMIKALAAVASASKPLELHIKVDTGMGRLGCRPEDAAELAALISGSKNLWLGGMATHLSVADSKSPSDIAYTKEQLACFRQSAESVRKAGIDPGLLHAANSGAICFHEDSYLDMVRPGIMLYGYSPASPPDGPISLPVMELRSAVGFIKKVRAGEEISYGRSWKAPEDTYVGTLSIGYADGLPRLLSGTGYSVLIRGKTYPLIGRVNMDQCMVNLGNDGEVQRWDEAVIFGPGFSTANDIAKKTSTIPHEILCNINKRVPRVY